MVSAALRPVFAQASASAFPAASRKYVFNSAFNAESTDNSVLSRWVGTLSLRVGRTR